MSKTIEMYQDPKDEIYCTIRELAKRNGIKIIYAQESKFENLYMREITYLEPSKKTIKNLKEISQND